MHASAKLTEAFNELLMSDHPIVVPNLVHYEVVNALWKYVRAGTIDAERCRRLLFAFLCLPLRLVDDDQLHLEASDMANHLLGLTGYDGQRRNSGQTTAVLQTWPAHWVSLSRSGPRDDCAARIEGVASRLTHELILVPE
jgi:hypothetical protein